MRNIGLAVQHRIATEFNGDPEKMRFAATAELKGILKVDTGSWSAVERAAFENFAIVLLLVPELRFWTRDQKQALVKIILAKASPDESDYLRLLQLHDALKLAVVALGSSKQKDALRRFSSTV